MKLKKTAKKIKDKSATRSRKTSGKALEGTIITASTSLSYRDLMYLARSISTGDIRDINKMSNAGRKAYSTVKGSIVPVAMGTKENNGRIRVGTTYSKKISKEKASKIIDNVIWKKEMEMTEGVDLSSVRRKIDGEVEPDPCVNEKETEE